MLAHAMLLTECRLDRKMLKCDIERTEWAEVTPSPPPQRAKTTIRRIRNNSKLILYQLRPCPHPQPRLKIKTKKHYTCFGRTPDDGNLSSPGVFLPAPKPVSPPCLLPFYSNPDPAMPERHLYQMRQAKLNPNGRNLKSCGGKQSS